MEEGGEQGQGEDLGFKSWLYYSLVCALGKALTSLSQLYYPRVLGKIK